MADTAPEPECTAAPLPLLPYHLELLDYLRREESDLWHWFVSNPVRERRADSVRLSLLRSAYRIERDANSRLYQVVDDVVGQMNVGVPVTMYQAQTSSERNASMAWLPEEAHVVLHGNVLELLSDAELHALVAHELAHHELYTVDDSAFLTMEQVLSALINDSESQPAHAETWRAFRLYTELYCDRRALDVSENLHSVVAALVKLETGLKEVSAEAYLAQADEILCSSPKESEGLTHPEMYVRAKALATWHADQTTADGLIRPLIEGQVMLSSLDLLQQDQLTRFTEQFIRLFLQPKWLRTPVTLGHVRRFFTDFNWEDAGCERVTKWNIDDLLHDPQIERYLCFLLLDFVTADPHLEDAPLAAAFLFADQHGLKKPFERLAGTELRLGKKHFQRIRSDADEIVAAAKQEFAE